MTDILADRMIGQHNKHNSFGVGYWIFFEMGNIAKPLLILDDHSLSYILDRQGFMMIDKELIKKLRDEAWKNFQEGEDTIGGQAALATMETYSIFINEYPDGYNEWKEKSK